MSLHRIDFSTGFVEHLAALGVAIGLNSAIDIDEHVLVETPVTPGNVDFWQAPASVGASAISAPAAPSPMPRSGVTARSAPACRSA